MRTSNRLSRRSVAGLVAAAAFALCAFGASSASAASWVQGETSMEWKASNLTLKLNGGSPHSCEMYEPTGWPIWLGTRSGTTGEGAVTDGTPYDRVTLYCDGGTSLEFCACVAATKKVSTGVYTMAMYNFWPGIPTGESPYGTYAQEEGTGTFANGTAGSPSTLTFNNAKVGRLYGSSSVITISGTIEVSEEEGGLLTLEG